MSHIIYGQNKILCFIDLSEELKLNNNQFLKINELVLTVYHFQYPCIYYEKIFIHFKNLLPKQITFKNIRLTYNGEELPSDLPIGLFIQNQGNLKVTLNKIGISEPYNIIKQAWKEAFSGINPMKGNYYVAKQIGDPQLRKRFQLYKNGESHRFQKQQFQGYEGTNIITRFFIEGEIVQRKSQTGEQKTISDLIKQEIPQVQGKQILVKSHGFSIDKGMTLKQFLDQWSYNDGFCYVKIDILS